MNGLEYKVSENIIKEMTIQKYLTDSKHCPHSIVKYISSFETDNDYYLIMEDGGDGLFEFIVKAHHFIQSGEITISEWHKVVKIIFKQMIECIEYIHSQNVCHFDISLENFLINDVSIEIHNTPNGDRVKFDTDKICIKLCDFGYGLFLLFVN